MSVEKVVHHTFEAWKQKADTLGWVHCHDNFVVCDDDADQCIGEFESSALSGWLIQPV